MTRRRVGLAGALVGLAVVALLAVLVDTRWPPLVRLDASAGPGGPAWRGVASVLTWAGSPGVVEAVVAVAAVVLFRRGRRRAAAFLAVAVVGAEVLSTLTKEVVARVRPCSTLAHVACPRSFSFPSGHSVSAAVGYLALACVVRRRPRVQAADVGVAVGVAVVVAATRVVLGVHYLSDVAAGLALGWGWVGATTAVLARRDRAGSAG